MNDVLHNQPKPLIYMQCNELKSRDKVTFRRELAQILGKGWSRVLIKLSDRTWCAVPKVMVDG